MHVSQLELANPADLRTAVATLIHEAFARLAADEGMPDFGDQLDTNGWNRFGQREFGAKKRIPG
ncbi:hypothetical protein AB0368_33225 [Actinoplanes sp. NPDC051475]|uniref:hypothetical protein n=1 Tax=Actinoplanes sp. NPDC051475 TaxID=3157225 RepID=UPI00344E4D55